MLLPHTHTTWQRAPLEAMEVPVALTAVTSSWVYEGTFGGDGRACHLGRGDRFMGVRIG